MYPGCIPYRFPRLSPSFTRACAVSRGSENFRAMSTASWNLEIFGGFYGEFMVVLWDFDWMFMAVYGDFLGCYGILIGDSKMAIRKEPPKMLENHGKPLILLVLMGISLG